MHVAQIMLVELDDDDDNIQSAVDSQLADYLEGGGGTWFDWFGEGAFGAGLAGRWSGQVIEGDWMRYSDDPAKAEEVIDRFMQQRLTNLQDAQDRMRDFDLSTAEYGVNDGDGMEPYAAYSAAKILMDYWTYDSGLYDLSAGTANLRWFRERVTESPTQQYLVVVDFHF